MDVGEMRSRVLSRRRILGVLGVAGASILAACGQQQTASPTSAPAAKATTAPTTAAVSATKPAAGTTPAASTPAAAGTTAAGTPAAAATKPAAGVTAAAGTPAAAATKPAAGGAPATTPAAAAKSTATALPQLGGTVSVLATWGGEEQESFLAMVKPFEDQTGARIQYEGTRDLGAVLTTRVQGNNPPDLAGLPGPGQMAQFARQNQIIDLSTILDMNAMRAQYSNDWLQLASAEGRQTGIFIKVALKGPIWYNPKAFQQGGYQVPTSWDAVMDLSERIANTGTTPWSIGLESGAASGWPGTDWIEDILLRQAGPDVYDRWHQGQVKWSSDEIRQAWQTWGEIVGGQNMVFGGQQYMLATNFGDSANPLFQNPPQAFLHHQGSFITTFITEANPNLKPVQDFDFFPFPDINQQHRGAVIAAGDLFGMFKQTEQSSALIRYLASPEAQAIWVRRGGALSANKQVALDTYPDDLSRKSAQTLTGAQIVRFDGSDLMPEAMNNAFFSAILNFVQSPNNLDSVLTELDRVQADAYRS